MADQKPDTDLNMQRAALPGQGQRDDSSARGTQPRVDGGASEALDRLDEHATRSLADRSDDEAAANASSMAGFAKFAAMGFEFFGVILIFGLVGHWLDDKYGFGGVATVVAIVVAFVGEMYLQIKTILRKSGKK